MLLPLTFGRQSSFAQRWKRSWSSFTPSQTGVTIHALKNITFPYIWLRDSCQSPECIHPSTKQKLHRTSDIPLDIKPVTLSNEGIKINDQGLEIKWSDGHQSLFPRAFLERHSSNDGLHKFHKDIAEITWDNGSIQKSDLFIPYNELINTAAGLVRGINQLAKYGLLFMTNVPNEETSNERCELLKLASTFGEVRPTFYGLLWDVMNVRESKNIAYTNLNLGLHMDLLYFQHPPRYQILHCLRNRVQGGTSIFVDAVAAADKLRKTYPKYFDTLTTSPVAFHYVNDGHHLHHEHPTIELAPSSPFSSEPERRINHINYSPPFQAPLAVDTPTNFYPALKEFSKLVNNQANTYKYTLREGDAVLFDNRRVLHARTAFREKEKREAGWEPRDGEPNRWLKGCYLEADAIMDRGRVLKTRLEQGLL